MQPQYNKFYWWDDKTGATLANPILQGMSHGSFEMSPNGTIHKFTLGDDPFDQTMVETCYIPGYKSGDLTTDQTQGKGIGLFAPDDYDTWYMIRNKHWEKVETVSKYE